jgi:RNA polymerase-binding transcription factor DksA
MGSGSSDNLDVAADLQQAMNEEATARVQRAAAPETSPDFDGEHCIVCGDEIPEARLMLRRIRCVLCQTAKEKRERK